MNKFFKSKSKKESKFTSLEVVKNKRQTTPIMGSSMGMLASISSGVVDKDISSDNTGVVRKNQGSLQPQSLGIIEGYRKIHKEKNQMVQSPMEKSIKNSSIKTTFDNGEETLKRVEVEETFIRKQSYLKITKGLDEKIVVARKTHVTERSVRLRKNYLNNDKLNDVEVSSTTQDDHSSLINRSNDWNQVSLNSDENVSSKNKFKTYKNAQKIIGLSDSSESDSTILLTPRNLKKHKKIKNNTRSLSKNKNRILKDKPKLDSLVNTTSEPIKSVNPLSDSKFNQKDNPPLLKKNSLNRKMGCKRQDRDITESDSTISLTPIESQNITKNDSDSTVLLTPVEQNTCVKNDKHEIDSDSTIFLTPIKQQENRKKKMNKTFSESDEPPKKKSKNFQICKKVSNKSINEIPQKFSSQKLKEKCIKIIKEEKLKKKIMAICKHEGSAHTDTSPTFLSQELKDELVKILEDEESVSHNKSPSIDELREKLTEIFGDDVSDSQIEPPHTLSTQEVLNVLKPDQNDNTTDDTPMTNRSDCLNIHAVDDSNETVHLSLNSVQPKGTENLIDFELNNKFVKTASNNLSLIKNLNTDSLSLNEKQNLHVKKSKAAKKKKNFNMNEKKSINQDESNAKKLKVVEENEHKELDDTLKLDESNDSQGWILDDTLKLPEVPESADDELVEFMDSNYENYNEESDGWTDSSIGKLIIDESASEITEFLDTSNFNEITENLIDNEKGPLCVDNHNDSLAVCVYEGQNQPNEEQQINSLEENKESDSCVRLIKSEVDNSDFNLKKLEQKRELLILIERVDVDKYKRKNTAKVSDSSEASSSLEKKISLSNSQAELFDSCLKKELRVMLERLPSKMNQKTLKNKNRINRIKPKNKMIRKSNNSQKKGNKIIKHKSGKADKKNQIFLKEIQIILTPITWKDQDLKNKQANNSGIEKTLISSAVNTKVTRRIRDSLNEDRVLSSVSKSIRKSSDSAKKIKTSSRAKLSSKVVKNAPNTNNLTRNKKMKSNLKAIKTTCNLANLSQHQSLKKELRVTLERISIADTFKNY